MAFKGCLFSLRLHGGSLELHHGYVHRKHIWARRKGKNFKKREGFFLALEETKGFGYEKSKLRQNNGNFFHSGLGSVVGQGFIIYQRLEKDGIYRLQRSQRSGLFGGHPFSFSVFEVLQPLSVLHNTGSR